MSLVSSVVTCELQSLFVDRCFGWVVVVGFNIDDKNLLADNANLSTGLMVIQFKPTLH